MTSNTVSILQLDGEGSANVLQSIEPDQLNQHPVWIHLNLSQAKSFLTKHAIISNFATTLLCAKETRPRIVVHEEALMGSFRGVNLQQNDNPENMASIRFYLYHNLIITVQKKQLTSTVDIVQALKNKIGPKTAAEFVENLLMILTEKASDLILDMDAQLDKIEDQTTDYQYAKLLRHKLSDLRRKIIMLKRHLQPQRDALIHLPYSKISWLTETDILKLQETSDATQRIIEDLEEEKDRASVIYEELFSLAQERLNVRMYVLSIVASIFLPLTFLTGLLGINVGGIPGSSYKYAFWIVCILMFLCAGFITWLLKWKKWI